MDTREKIEELLGKIASDRALQRIYRFVKYLYIYGK